MDSSIARVHDGWLTEGEGVFIDFIIVIGHILIDALVQSLYDSSFFKQDLSQVFDLADITSIEALQIDFCKAVQKFHGQVSLFV